MPLTIQLAFRFLFSKRRGGFLSVSCLVSIVGLAFGVAVLLIAQSVATGFQTAYRKAILGFNSHVVLMNADEIESPEAIQTGLAAYGRVSPMRGASPFIYREGMIVSGSTVKGAVFKGLDFAKYGELSRVAIRRSADASRNAENLPEIFLGKTLAEDLGLKDPVLKVLFPEGLTSKKTGVQGVKKFFVAGTFETGLHEYDASFAFLDLGVAKTFFRTGGRVSGLEIWLDDPEKAGAWAEAMRADFGYPYAVMTWSELNENVFKAVAIEKLLFTILMAVLIAIAALNLVGTLMMLFLERRGEAAVLRAVGMSWKRLRKIFIFDGLLIGSGGILLGLGLGAAVILYLQHGAALSLAPEVYFVDRVPVVWSWRIVAQVAAAALAIIALCCRWATGRMERVSLTRSLLEA